MRYVFRILIFFLMVSASGGQLNAESPDVEGDYRFEVTSLPEKESLRGVTCRVFTPQGKMRGFAISDKAGHLTVKARKGDRIEFGMMGYAKAGALRRVIQPGNSIR